MGFFDYPEDEEQAHTAVTVLADAPEEAWNRLVSLAENRIFSAGEEIVHAGEEDDAVYLLAEGSVEVVFTSSRSSEAIVVITEGAVFGEITFFDQLPRTATIRALTNGSALRITRKVFNEFAAWEPNVARQFLLDLGKTMALRLRHTMRMTE